MAEEEDGGEFRRRIEDEEGVGGRGDAGGDGYRYAG